MKKYMKHAFDDLAYAMEQKCGDWQKLPDTEADKKLRERIMAKVINIEKQQTARNKNHGNNDNL